MPKKLIKKVSTKGIKKKSKKKSSENLVLKLRNKFGKKKSTSNKLIL